MMKSLSFRRGINRDWLTFGLLAFCLYLRVFFAGVRYYPALDDYIQYGCYPLYENIWQQVFVRVGLLAKRPLASVFDVFVWGGMWNKPALALFIIINIYVLTLFFIYKAFEMDKTKNGIFFLVFAGLSPLMDEGIYWISASSRLVMGMFFGSIAVYLLYLSLRDYEKKYLPYVLVLTVISFCFYEQAVTAVFILLMMVMFQYRERISDKRVYFIPCVALAFIGLYYLLAPQIWQGDWRVSGGMGFSFVGVFDGLGQFFDIVFRVQWEYLTDTLLRGFRAIFENGGMFYLALVILSAAGMGFAAYISYEPKYIMNRKERNTSMFLLLGGILLVLGGLSPNLLAKDVWICLRNMLVPIIGIGFLWLLLAKTVEIPRLATGILVFAAVFVFTVSGIGDISIYKAVSMYDNGICSSAAEAIKEDATVWNGEKQSALIVKSSFYEEMKPYYKDHVKSVTYSDWSLTGGVRAAAKNVNIKTITPIADGDTVFDMDKLFLLLERDGRAVPVYIKGNVIADSDGKTVGKWIDNIYIMHTE